MLRSIQRYRERYAGALVALLGLGAITVANGYGLGTPSAIGPGAFPMAMGVILVACGLGIGMQTEDTPDDPKHGPKHEPGHDQVELSHPDWRGWGCILGGMAGFILVARTLGLFPATFVCVFVSALGDRTASIKGAAILAAVIAALGCALFYYGLHVQLPPFVWGLS